jgi:hypothetical protein
MDVPRVIVRKDARHVRGVEDCQCDKRARCQHGLGKVLEVEPPISYFKVLQGVPPGRVVLVKGRQEDHLAYQTVAFLKFIVVRRPTAKSNPLEECRCTLLNKKPNIKCTVFRCAFNFCLYMKKLNNSRLSP